VSAHDGQGCGGGAEQSGAMPGAVAVGQGSRRGAGAGPVAAIDCGTNSTRLLVLGGSGAELVRLMRITRLGEGVDEHRLLTTAAVERTLAVLEEFAAVLSHHRVVALRATATSAARDAANADLLFVRAAEILSHPLELLSGPEEGRLCFGGATADLDPRPGADLVVDLGGGSTELVTAGGSVSVSLDIGCVRATERYLHHDPPTQDELAELRARVALLVRDALAEHPELTGPHRVVGVAGTVSALVMLARRATVYSFSTVHHQVLCRREVERLLVELAAADLAERRRRPGLEEARADVIVGGAAVLAEVMAGLGANELIASERDILDGLAVGLLERELTAT